VHSHTVMRITTRIVITNSLRCFRHTSLVTRKGLTLLGRPGVESVGVLPHRALPHAAPPAGGRGCAALPTYLAGR